MINYAVFNRSPLFLKGLLATGICVAAVIPISVFAEPGQYGGKAGKHNQAMTPEQREAKKQRRETHHKEMMEKLGVSAEQSQKIEAIRNQNKSESQALSEQIHTKRKALMQYMSSDSSNASQASAQQQEIDQLQGQLSKLRMSTWFEIRKNLTPEQLQKMQTMRKEHHSHKGGGAVKK